MIWAFEVETARSPRSRAAPSRSRCERDVLLRPIGNTVYFMPPYVIGDEEFAMLVEAGARHRRRSSGRAA